ncbi:MAG: type II toxin-antitoxin system VapC family toxin [Bdellovibrionota bacterium]
MKPVRYFDSSALVKRYIRESETPLVASLLAESEVVVSRIAEAEVASALGRACRDAKMTHADASRAMADLRKELELSRVVEVTSAVTALASALLLRRPLRSLDAIQLASCLLVAERTKNPIELVVFDARLVEAAVAEGLSIRPKR